jgi:transposase-like protein
MKAPQTLQQAIQYFADYENCRQFMVAMRWEDGKVRCPHCQSTKVTYLEKARVYRCYGDHAKQKFSLKVGTVLEDSPIGLDKWFPVMWMMVNCKNGISSYEVARNIGITQKSAWFMLHRIRTALKDGIVKKMGGTGGPVEVDESFIGGSAKNWHLSKRAKRVRFSDKSQKPYPEKTAVVGLLDRETRQVRAQVIPNVSREILQDVILNGIAGNGTVYTDGWKSYANLKDLDFVHETVNHLDEYVRGEVHTNGIENFWSLLKRGLRGTYVAVEPFHLEKYVDEQVFRFNNRATRRNPLNDADRFIMAVSQIAGKRLTYAELTGKEGKTAF